MHLGDCFYTVSSRLAYKPHMSHALLRHTPCLATPRVSVKCQMTLCLLGDHHVHRVGRHEDDVSFYGAHDGQRRDGVQRVERWYFAQRVAFVE
eukprot:3662167-Prymnesium_polylepis.1